MRSLVQLIVFISLVLTNIGHAQSGLKEVEAEGMAAVLGESNDARLRARDEAVEDALRNLAVAREISVIPETGRIPDNSVTIDPDQNVLTSNKVEINAKVVPVGVADDIDVSLSLATTI